MKYIIEICDHCRKTSYPRSSWSSGKIIENNNEITAIQFDLCKKCHVKFKTMIRKFFGNVTIPEELMKDIQKWRKNNPTSDPIPEAS